MNYSAYICLAIFNQMNLLIMKPYKLSGFLMFIVLILFTSCGKIQDVEIRGADNLQYRGFKDNHVEFQADLNVYNPSARKIVVQEIDMKLMVNDNYLGRIRNVDEIEILPRSEGYITIPFRLRITNIFTGISTIKKLYNHNNLKVEVDGYVTAKSGIIKKKIDVRRTTYVDSLKP